MSYQSFPYIGLGRGLNLRDKPDAVDQQECIDAMNVQFSERGAVLTRAGYDQVVGSAITGLTSFENTSGSKRLLAIVGSNLVAYTTGGTSVTTTALTNSSTPMDSARIGTPGNEYLYLSNGTDFRRFNGTAFSTPANMPKGQVLTVQATDNRLVSTGFLGATDGPSGATSSPSHVYFSNAGDPETWDANNYVQLTPGDGERIIGAIAWQGLTFIFKETKFFIFYGNSVDAGGDPVFNYRPVEAHAGLASRQGLTKTDAGVFFVAEEGIYLTTGAAPTKISDKVDPLFEGGASSFYTGGIISDLSTVSLTNYQHRLYMAFTSVDGQRVLVSDPPAGWMSLYDLPAKYVHAFDGDLYFGNTALHRHNGSIQDDNGAPIKAHWRSGWTDFGSPDVKAMRATKLWGAGDVFIARQEDFKDSLGNEELLAFTTTAAPQWNDEEWNISQWAAAASLTPKQTRRAVRGTTFSTNLRGEAPWAVHRLDHLIRQVRQPGIEDS
jgi:hypothetical protein